MSGMNGPKLAQKAGFMPDKKTSGMSGYMVKHPPFKREIYLHATMPDMPDVFKKKWIMGGDIQHFHTKI